MFLLFHLVIQFCYENFVLSLLQLRLNPGLDIRVISP